MSVAARQEAALDALAGRIADQLAPIVAELVADRLTGQPHTPQLVDAAAVADALGVEPRWVREHAAELGAVRLDPAGNGSKPRLRFDLEAVLAANGNGNGHRQAEPEPPRPRRSRRRDGTAAGSVLAVRGRS